MKTKLIRKKRYQGGVHFDKFLEARMKATHKEMHRQREHAEQRKCINWKYGEKKCAIGKETLRTMGTPWGEQKHHCRICGRAVCDNHWKRDIQIFPFSIPSKTSLFSIKACSECSEEEERAIENVYEKYISPPPPPPPPPPTVSPTENPSVAPSTDPTQKKVSESPSSVLIDGLQQDELKMKNPEKIKEMCDAEKGRGWPGIGCALLEARRKAALRRRRQQHAAGMDQQTRELVIGALRQAMMESITVPHKAGNVKCWSIVDKFGRTKEYKKLRKKCKLKFCDLDRLPTEAQIKRAAKLLQKEKKQKGHIDPIFYTEIGKIWEVNRNLFPQQGVIERRKKSGGKFTKRRRRKSRRRRYRQRRSRRRKSRRRRRKSRRAKFK